MCPFLSSFYFVPRDTTSTGFTDSSEKLEKTRLFVLVYSYYSYFINICDHRPH